MRSRRGLILILGPCLALLAVAWLWRSARLAEVELRIRTDAALAHHAVRYLAVITPAGAEGGYDARRLLSAANALADASFWLGGLQIALGQVPLVPDTIDLAPLPPEILGQLEAGAPYVLTTHGRLPAVVVPFPDRDHSGLLGWAAAWGTVRPNVPSAHAALLTVLSIGAIGVVAVGFQRQHSARWRVVVFSAAMASVAVLALDLGWSVYRTARVGTDRRLLIMRRLVEIAATGEGVRQSRLSEIGAGATIRVLRRPIVPSEDVMRDEEDGEPVARILAATPRTQGGIVFSTRPLEEDLGGLWLRLLAGLQLGALALAVTGWAARNFDPVRGGAVEPSRTGSAGP